MHSMKRIRRLRLEGCGPSRAPPWSWCSETPPAFPQICTAVDVSQLVTRSRRRRGGSSPKSVWWSQIGPLCEAGTTIVGPLSMSCAAQGGELERRRSGSAALTMSSRKMPAASTPSRWCAGRSPSPVPLDGRAGARGPVELDVVVPKLGPMTCAMAPQSASLRMSRRKACEYWFGVLMRWMSVGSEGSKEKTRSGAPPWRPPPRSSPGR